MDFDKIALSRAETKALKLLDKSNLLLDGNSREALNRLVHLELADKYPYPSEGQMRWGVKINDAGKDYLMYLKRETRNRVTQSRRYWITTGIAIVALILSIIALLWQTYTWKYELPKSEVTFSSSDPVGPKSGGEPEGCQQNNNNRVKDEWHRRHRVAPPFSPPPSVLAH